MKYAIAASHSKIKRRFETLLSKEYLHCFLTMKPELVGFSLRLGSSHKRERLQHEIENDHEFLDLLEIRGDGVVPDYRTEYPRIVEITLKNRFLRDYTIASKSELFNNATCEEYHRLFQHLISQYRNTVRKISELAQERASFETEVDLAVKTGHMLLTMVKGRAFHVYLSAIAVPLLSLSLEYQKEKQHKRLRLALASEARQIASDERDADGHDADERNADEREADERDADEHEIESASTLWVPIGADGADTDNGSWQKFKSWIMLILVQLDAADALCGFVKRPELTQAEIDVKLVYSPLVPYETIALEELLRAGYISQPDGAEKTNAELLKFVEAANVRKGQLKSLRIFQKKWDKKRVSAAKAFTNGVLSQAQKEDLEVAGGEQETGKVSPNATILALCKDIMTILDQKPADDLALDNKFSALAEQLTERQPLPFNESATFRGTLHCKAGLASILDQSTRGIIQARIDAADPKDEQVCRSLLELLDRTQVGFFLYPTCSYG